MKTSANQQFAGLYSAVAQVCAGFVRRAARNRGAGLALAVMNTTTSRNRCLKLGLGLFLMGAAAINLPAAQYDFTTLKNPLGVGYQGTSALGISGTNVVGWFDDSTRHRNGFLYNGSTYTTMNATYGGGTPAISTIANGISGNNVVGYYMDASYNNHGFLYNGSSYTRLNEPSDQGAVAGAFAMGVSGNKVVGYYGTATGNHGFLYNGSTYTRRISGEFHC